MTPTRKTLFVLYRILDSSGTLLYVGATTNPKLRFSAAGHAGDKSWWSEVATISLQHFDDLDSLIAAEREAIESENPQHNSVYCKPAHWARKRRSERGSGTVFQRADGYWVAGMEMPPGLTENAELSGSSLPTEHVAIQRLELFKSSLKQPKECLVEETPQPGDGTLFKRADGYWVGGVELPAGSDGTRRFKRIVRKDRNDARSRCVNSRPTLPPGRSSTRASTTVAKWMEHWRTEILPLHSRTLPEHAYSQPLPNRYR